MIWCIFQKGLISGYGGPGGPSISAPVPAIYICIFINIRFYSFMYSRPIGKKYIKLKQDPHHNMDLQKSVTVL